MKLWPLFNRRLDFFRFEQKDGQQFSDFAAKLELKALEADLHTLTPEEIMVHWLICGCKITELKEKFLRLDSPDKAALERTYKTYEVGKVSISKAKDQSKNQSNKAFQKKKKGGAQTS